VVDLESDRQWILGEPDDRPVTSWRFDSRGRLVVTRGGLVSRWDPRTEETETLLEGTAPAWPFPGDRLIRPTEDGRSWLIDPADGSRSELTLHGSPSALLSWDPSGTVFVRNHRDGSVMVWSDPDIPPHLLLGHEGEVYSTRISPDRRWVSTIGADGTLRLWPMPDLNTTPFEALPHRELLARLRTLTNLRVVADESSTSGYTVEADLSSPRGWAEVPTW
jgi:WD40 repeat protein